MKTLPLKSKRVQNIQFINDDHILTNHLNIIFIMGLFARYTPRGYLRGIAWGAP